jgi:hypothetical protein
MYTYLLCIRMYTYVYVLLCIRIFCGREICVASHMWDDVDLSYNEETFPDLFGFPDFCSEVFRFRISQNSPML